MLRYVGNAGEILEADSLFLNWPSNGVWSCVHAVVGIGHSACMLSVIKLCELHVTSLCLKSCGSAQPISNGDQP